MRPSTAALPFQAKTWAFPREENVDLIGFGEAALRGSEAGQIRYNSFSRY
jgi:hypothetical protein